MYAYTHSCFRSQETSGQGFACPQAPRKAVLAACSPTQGFACKGPWRKELPSNICAASATLSTRIHWRNSVGQKVVARGTAAYIAIE